MLRNSYFEPYKKVKRKKSEYEKVILNNDGEHILFLQRPLSMLNIKRLPKSEMPIFVNDLMCDKETGHLLYPLSFRKQVDLYLKQQSYVYKITTFNKNKNFIEMLKALKKKKEKELDEDSKNKKISNPKLTNFKKREEIKEMKINLQAEKIKNNNIIKKLRNKNKKFYKNQPLIDRKLRKLSFQPVNDIRIRGYEKAFEECNKRSLANQEFNLPDIAINESSVYSRLYNNIIVKNKTRNYNNKSQGFSESIYRDEKNYINTRSSSLMRHNASYLQKNNIDKKKKEQTFHISNINKNLDGKEFTKKVTVKMKKRCLSAFSGGPRNTFKRDRFYSNINHYNKNKKPSVVKKIIKKFVNYHAKLTTKNCFLKMKPDEAIKKNAKTIDLSSETINDLILANSNSRIDLINIKKFRDSDYNTNLHRSVLRNNIKFVDYFIKKNLDINKKNKNGDTALHLAFKIGNYDIIQLLLEHGASIKIKNKKGISPFDLADKDMRTAFNLVEIYNNPNEY